MVSKCANPDCSAPFRYFHTGKLFRAETPAGLDRRRTLGQDAGEGKPLRHLEFFWLCADCAEKMTVVFDKDSGVCVRHKNYARAAAVC
jgi:hypothetical protein